MNFSFVAARELEPFEYAVVTGDGSGRALGVALKNPISADLAVMRTSLVPSLLKNAVTNRRQRVEDLRLYEIARTYCAGPEAGRSMPSSESLQVAGVLLGRRHPVGWAAGGDAVGLLRCQGGRVRRAGGARDRRACEWKAPGRRRGSTRGPRPG